MTPDHVTSPSQAGSYDECPRKYALERFATHKDAESVYLQFGNLIHKVLEIAELTAVDGGRSRSTLEEASAVLDSLWDELGFGSDAVGRSWRRRADGVLVNLFEKWPTSADPLKIEHVFSTDLEGTQWSGKADRIEQSAGNLKVIDYKTSKQPATNDEAKASLQLGFYILAAMADPEVAAHGDVTGASFWYPAANPNKHAIATRDFDMGNLDAVKDRLVDIAHAIAAEKFEPVVNASCDRCEFISVCPAQKEGREAFAT
jgi:RecB family exonuclease